MKRVKWLIAFLMVIGFASMAVAGTLEEIAQRGELRVACQTQGPPFSFIDKNGKRTGSSIELCEMLAKDMGVKVTFLDYDWDGLIPALLSKKADILAADMTATLKRSLKVSFTDPFYMAGSVIFKKKGAPFKTIDQCNKENLTVAVLL